MNEEEYFRKNYPDFCYGDKPLSPYWDFFQDGVEFGERQSEKKIEELEKELKDADKKVVHLACNQNKDLKYKLIKAKEYITEFMRISIASVEEYEPEFSELIEKAEQFLNCSEKPNN